MGNSRAWQVVALVFIAIGLPQVARGLADGSTGELVVGIVALAAAVSSSYEARSQHRKAEKDPTQPPPKPGRSR